MKPSTEVELEGDDAARMQKLSMPSNRSMMQEVHTNAVFDAE
jgi:hypothetical protein